VNNFTKSTANPAVVDYNLYDSPLAAGNASFVWIGNLPGPDGIPVIHRSRPAFELH